MASPDAQSLNRIVSDLDVNFIVEAGAGTGKTYALVSRVVALVKSGVRMENIVAITFTEAAAAELSDRVRSRMEQLLDDGHPDNEGDLLYVGIGESDRVRLRQAVSELDRASIQTIHSFAAQLLRQRPMEIGLPPGWSQWDALTSAEDFSERWAEWMEWALGEPDESNERLSAALRKLLESRVGVSEWKKVAEGMSGVSGSPNWQAVGGGVNLADVADRTINELEGLAALCPDPSHPLLGQLKNAIETVRAVAASESSEDAAAALAAGTPLSPSGGAGSRAKWGDMTPAQVRAQFTEIGGGFGIAVRSALLSPLVESLYQWFAVDYPALRKADGVATFGDLLAWARDLLRQPGARAHFQSRYTHVLIDEFQDTDPLQAEMGFYLASEPGIEVNDLAWHELPLAAGRLFIVGDDKQSIYGFRGADLGVTQLVKSGGQLEPLTLRQNRRSQSAVLDWVNRVFGAAMAGEAETQADYVPLEAFNGIQRDGMGAGVRLFGGGMDDAVGVIRGHQARHLASLVRSYTSGGPDSLTVYDKATGGVRAARLADICILISRRTGLGILERGLEDAGIPYRIEGGSLMFNTQEVRDLLNCLRAIDNPADAVSVAAALRSPAFACSDVDLMNWREAGGTWNYTHERLPVYAGAVRDAMTTLRWYHEKRHRLPVHQLISEFVRDRRLEELDLAEDRPREMWRRRQFLIDQARSLANTDGGNQGGAPWNLNRFVAWAELQQTGSVRITELPVPETDDDSVRIMTMHAAKGLEFPIVIILGLDRAESTERGTVLRDARTGGVEVSLGSASGGTLIRTPGYQALAESSSARGAAEDVRLAYVASTRARDHLLVSLYHKTNSQGTAPNLVMGTIMDLRGNDLASEAMAELGQPEPPRPTIDAVTPDSLDYNLDEWLSQRDDANQKRAAPQAVTATQLARGSDPQGVAAGPVAVEVIEDKEAEPDSEQPWLTGRGGTAFGSALHAVLQDAMESVLDMLPLQDGEPVDAVLAALHQAIERLSSRSAEDVDVPNDTEAIVQLAKSAVRSDAVIAALKSQWLWPEIPVAAPMESDAGQVVIEGIIDLLYLDHDDELVILDYKSDDVRDQAAVEAKLSYYQWQGAAYAAAVETATGKRVKDVQFLFVRLNRTCSLSNFRDLMERLPERVPQI